MTSLIETQAACRAAEARARAAAALLANKAAMPTATDTDGIISETATTILRIAELRARTLPREEMDEVIADARRTSAALLEDTRDKVGELPPDEGYWQAADELVGHTLAVLEQNAERVALELARRSLEAWHQASRDLATLAQSGEAPAHSSSRPAH